MRASLLLGLALGACVSTAAHADWTCSVERQRDDRSGATAVVIVDDEGTIKSEALHWTPHLASGYGALPLLMYDVTGKTLADGELTNIRILNQEPLVTAPRGRAFQSISVDDGEPVIREWETYGNPPEPPPAQPGRVLWMSGIVDFYASTDAALFEDARRPGAQRLKVSLIGESGNVMARAEYDLTSTMAEDRLSAQLMDRVRGMARNFRRTCQPS